MELIRPDIRVDFIKYRHAAMAFSGFLILMGMMSLILHGGPNYGIDFAGGTMVHIRFVRAVALREIRQALNRPGLGDIVIQDFAGAGREFLIRMSTPEAGKEKVAGMITQGLTEKFDQDAFEVLRVEMVGPKVGKDLRRKGILAVLFSTVMMGVYVAFRFQTRFGIGAAVALLHDVLVTVGALSLANMEFDITVVAALLTVVGFSVNDTVIVSDRIRENMRKIRRETMVTIVNRSINETLSRTIITTGTGLFVIVALFFLGGSVIHGFAFTLLVGFTVGTYSSIYVASPVVLLMEKGKRTGR